MLFRYLHVRTLTLRQHECSRRSSHNARRLGTWPSSVTLRGTRGAFDASALRKNACAAAIPRSRRSRKSTVLPRLRGGESPLHSRHGQVLAEGNGFPGDRESEGSRKQSAGATNRKRIEAAPWGAGKKMQSPIHVRNAVSYIRRA